MRACQIVLGIVLLSTIACSSSKDTIQPAPAQAPGDSQPAATPPGSTDGPGSQPGASTPAAPAPSTTPPVPAVASNAAPAAPEAPPAPRYKEVTLTAGTVLPARVARKVRVAEGTALGVTLTEPPTVRVRVDGRER